MVYRDNFRVTPDEEKTKYKFDFCHNCKFYECELISEYLQFKENHNSQNTDSTPGATAYHLSSTGRIVIKATARPADKNSETPINATAKVTTEDDSKKTTYLTYGKELKPPCFINSNVYQIECGNKRVTEGIGDHYKIEIKYDSIEQDINDRWEPTQPVFISAQTGQGKNYFIEHTLIPYVRELNHNNTTKYKVLILSNRLALKRQIENRLKGFEDTDSEENAIYSYGEFADVMTYQSLLHRETTLKNKQKSENSRYIYVICDEAHFFTSDAMFNPYTHKILLSIINLFRDAVRVYMSATPYECLEYINEYENKQDYLWNDSNQNKTKCKQIAFYHFKRDYGYLDVKAYSRIDELFGEIVESVTNKKENWLIFIDDRDKCEGVKKKLKEFAEENGAALVCKSEDNGEEIEQVFAVNADSKRNKTYMSIVKNEKLDKNIHVLITTSVLDNGVNLTGIHNIVVSDMSKVKCLQMVGRARVSNSDDKKTLYIKRFGTDEPDKRLKDIERQEDAYYMNDLTNNHQDKKSEYQFLHKYYDGNEGDWQNAKHWFGRPTEEPNKLYVNEIARSMLPELKAQYEHIRSEISEEAQLNDKLQGDGRIVGQKYLEYQFSWFGKEYCVDNDVTYADKNKKKKEFIAFLESYVSKEISKEEQEAFRKQFTVLHDAAFDRADPNKLRIYGIKKMNSLLEDNDLCYEIISESSNWKVCKIDTTSEDD